MPVPASDQPAGNAAASTDEAAGNEGAEYPGADEAASDEYPEAAGDSDSGTAAIEYEYTPTPYWYLCAACRVVYATVYSDKRSRDPNECAACGAKLDTSADACFRESPARPRKYAYPQFWTDYASSAGE